MFIWRNSTDIHFLFFWFWKQKTHEKITLSLTSSWNAHEEILRNTPQISEGKFFGQTYLLEAFTCSLTVNRVNDSIHIPFWKILNGDLMSKIQVDDHSLVQITGLNVSRE